MVISIKYFKHNRKLNLIQLVWSEEITSYFLLPILYIGGYLSNHVLSCFCGWWHTLGRFLLPQQVCVGKSVLQCHIDVALFLHNVSVNHGCIQSSSEPNKPDQAIKQRKWDIEYRNTGWETQNGDCCKWAALSLIQLSFSGIFIQGKPVNQFFWTKISIFILFSTHGYEITLQHNTHTFSKCCNFGFNVSFQLSCFPHFKIFSKYDTETSFSLTVVPREYTQSGDKGVACTH